MLTLRSTLLLLLAAGCQPDDLPLGDGDLVGRPFDISQTRIQTASGDRWETAFPIRRWWRPPHHPASTGDWNYRVGGTVTSSAAIYNNAFAGGPLTASCSDRLFVASTTSGGNNLFAFDRLSKRPPGASADCPTPPTDANCTRGPAPDRWCPRKIWQAALSGSVDRAFLNLSADGTQVYAATSTGMVYAVNTNSATTATYRWTFNARSEIGGTNNAGFVGSGAWVNYSDGSIYIAATYAVAAVSKIRLYKLSPADGSVLAKIDFSNDGIASSVIAYDAVYFGSTTGKLYKVYDNGTSFTAAAGWPLALWSAHGGANNTVVERFGQPIFGTPSIDGENNLLVVAVNNVFYSVNVFTAAINSIEGGWQSGTEATANDVPEFSSPWIDPGLMTVFLGHGKNQGAGQTGPRCHRRDYLADGTFNVNTLTSVATAGTSTDLSNPHSSPLVLHEASGSVFVYIGDPQGNLNRWSYTTDFGADTTFNTGQGQSIESPIIIDYLAGNIYFGDDSGRIYQISQSTLM